jgi:hypothetical protein
MKRHVAFAYYDDERKPRSRKRNTGDLAQYRVYACRLQEARQQYAEDGYYDNKQQAEYYNGQ